MKTYNVHLRIACNNDNINDNNDINDNDNINDNNNINDNDNRIIVPVVRTL